MMKSLLSLSAFLASTLATNSWPTQVPFWPQYPSRNVQVLTGTWQFGFTTDGDPTSLPYSSISTPNTTTVPGSFDVAPPGVLGPRGNAFFRSTHTCTPGLVSLLKFYAVNFYARVFVDGNDIGNHTAGGYTPFEMVSPPCGSSGSRELLVIVNNQQNYTLSPTFTGGDFYFYSGIIRPVIVTELPNSKNCPYWIDRIEPISTDYVKGLIDIRVVIGGDTSAADGSVHLTYSINNGPVSSSNPYALVNNTAIIPNVVIPNVTLWMPGQDNINALFTVSVTEAVAQDTVTTRTGLRVLGIDTTTARITINGKIVNLHGFNRHTMWPDTGAAVTPEQEVTDITLLKGVNANYVRGAHYPQSQSWLDRCDEAGIVIWEETLGPGTSTGNMHDPWFMANHLAAVSSMVGHSFHHPSVILHGFFNEGPSNDPNACVGYAQSAQTIRNTVGIPPMRFVTWANNHLSGDVCIASEDVISFNSYPGWYDHAGNATYPLTYWPEQIAWVTQNWPDKPLTVSETGGGGIYEWTNDTLPYPGVQWTQYYQKNLVTNDVSIITNNSRVSGLTVWQYADIKANDDATRSCGQCVYANTGGYPTGNLSIPWTCAYVSAATVQCGRPYGENHKGTVDFWRRIKEEYNPISDLYGAIPNYVDNL